MCILQLPFSKLIRCFFCHLFPKAYQNSFLKKTNYHGIIIASLLLYKRLQLIKSDEPL